MFNRNTADFLRIKNIEAQEVLKKWFLSLSERYTDLNGKQVNGRAWRAQMKRMEPPYNVIMCEGYHVLYQDLIKYMPIIDERALTLFVSVVVHIKSHKGGLSFAAQLGEKLKGDKPCLSALRFERLQKANKPELFCQQLISAVKIRGTDGVNILSLADSIFLWMEEWSRREANEPETCSPFERNRIRWANEYLSKAYAK